MKRSGIFSLRRLILSFRWAGKGILHAFKTQLNVWIHFAAMVIVIAAGFYFEISLMEWGLITFAVGIVLVSELMNTAVEYLVDLIEPEINEKAGLIKDIAAGAVLLAAGTALVIGLIVFIPKIG